MAEKRNPPELSGGRDILPEELHFHSRETPPEPEDYRTGAKKRGGVFKNNPSLILILVDIVVVLLVLIILLPLLRYDSRVEDFSGYDFSLHGYLDGKVACLSVTAQPDFAPVGPAEIDDPAESAAPVGPAEGGNAAPSGEMEKYSLILSVLDTDLQEEMELSRDGRARILRAQFTVPETAWKEKIYFQCRISLGEKTVTLQRTVSP